MRVISALLVAGVLTACASPGRQPAGAVASTPGPELDATPEQAVLRLQQLERGRRPALELSPYLEHDDAAVRARAALALARVADPAGTTALVRALADPTADVRALAAFALGALDPVLPLLAEQIVDGHKGSEAWVREAAQARADAERALDARLHIDSQPKVRRAVYAALGQLVIGPGLHHIYAGLGESDEDAALAALAYSVHAVRRGETAHRSEELTARLIELGASADAEVRFGAALALARHERCAAEALFADRLVVDSDVRVRLWSARGLGSCSGGGEALGRALGDTDWRVRVESLRALQRRGRRGVEPDREAARRAAEQAIDDLGLTGPQLDLSAAHVLAAALPVIKQEKHLRALLARWQGRLSGADAVRQRSFGGISCAIAVALAARSLELSPLGNCDGQEAERLIVRRREVRALAWAVRERPANIARLYPYLSDPDPRVRVSAVQAVASGDDAATRALLRSLLAQETDAAVVEAIADTIGMWPTDASLVVELEAALARTADASESSVIAARTALVKAFVTHGKQTADARLRVLAEEEVLPVRNAVRIALGERPAFGVEPNFAPPPNLDVAELQARLRTSRGTIELRLLGAETPETVGNFVRLARRGFYDGQAFHRVVPGFVIQGGDPRGDGFGGPGYVIPCEITPRPYKRGVVGMALAGKDTGGSQFFIAQSRQPHLDGRYTAFGEVTSGLRVLDSILPGDVILGIDVYSRPADSR